AAVVGVAPKRRGPIGTVVGGGELAHPQEALPHVRLDREAGAPAVERRAEKELQDEAVIRGRALEVDAVRRHLAWQLRAEKRPPERGPAPPAAAVAEEEAGEDETGGVRSEMVAIHVGPLEVTLDKIRVRVEDVKEPPPERRVR